MTRLVALLVFLLSAVAWADEKGETEKIFERFVHSDHTAAFERAGLTCVTCHQVGQQGAGWSKDQLATWLVPPRNTCHECHAPGEGDLGKGIPFRGADRNCGTCHDTDEKPATHDVSWLGWHGRDAQADAQSCQMCHSRSFCVDCHDRRDDTRFAVHDAGWLTLHGVAVRANPGGCDGCHVQAECTSCHASTNGFGRSP